MMNHPNREEWIAYLYGELTEPAVQSLRGHLHDCPQCRDQLAAWEQTKSTLEAWQIPPKGKAIRHTRPVLKWAIAALFVVGIGFGFGYAAAPDRNSPDLADLREQLRTELRSELETALAIAQRQFTNQLTAAISSQLEMAARRTLDASIEQTESVLAAYDVKRQEAERSTLATLKNYFDARLAKQTADLETVALLTEATFRNAQRQISQLAGYSPSPSHLNENQ